MQAPRVSIGTPVWNGERFLRAGLDSLLRQTFGDFELIIADNASTDATQEICEQYAARDARVRYHRNAANIGLQGNFAKVLGLATAPYFMWGCPDDQWDPSYIAKTVAVLDANDSVVVVGSNAGSIADDGTLLAHFDNVVAYSPTCLCARVHRFICTPPGGGSATLIYGLMRTDVIQRVGYGPLERVRDLNRGHYAIDLLTLFRLLFEGEFSVVDETLYFHRDTLLGGRGLRRVAAIGRQLRNVHGYYGDLRAILATSQLDERQKSALARASFRQEMRYYPVYGRRLLEKRLPVVGGGG